MGLFEQSLSDQGVDPDIPPFVQPSGVYFKDADTFVTPDGKTVRLINSNAYETQKTGRTANAFSPAQTGADEQLIIARKVASDGGYNIPVLTGRKDDYGREIGDLQNSKGELFSNYMAGNRLVDTMMPDDNILTVRAVADLNKARDKGFGLAPTLADQYLSALNDVRHQDRLTAKVYANSAKQYGASLDPRGNSDVYTGAAEVQSDEDYKGDARSNLRTGFNSGYNQMMQGAWNGLDILGHITHQKGWEEKGQAYSRMYQNNLENLPNLRNGEAFDENGNWKLDSFSKLADYTVATAASSSPQMVLGIAATLAAPVTFGASVAAPAVVFAGQTWQHQKVKDPAWAIASGITQAVLETLGVERITGSIFHKATQEQVVKQLVRKGYTKEAAEQAIIAKSGKALADISDFAKAAMVKDATDAAMQLEKISVRSVGKAMLQGAIAEPVTESLQEVTQYFGEQSGFNLPTDEHGQNVLKNRVLNSAVGGLVLGGAFGGAGRVLANATNGRDIKPTEDVDLRKKITEQFSYVPSAEELGKDATNDVRNKDLHAKDLSLDELAQGEMSKRSASGLVGTVGNWWRDKGFSSLYDKWSNTLKGSDTNGNYSNALWTLLGSSRAFSGGSIEEQQARTNQELQNTFGSPEQIRNAFGTKSLNEVNGILMNPKVKATVAAVLNIMSSRNKTAVQAADMLADIDKLDGDLVKHSAGVLHYAQKVNDLLLAYNKKTGQNLDHEQFLTLSPVNRTAIQRHPSNFSSLLVQHLGIGKQEADEITTRFTTDADMQMVTDPFEEMFNPNHKAQKTLTELNKLMVKSPGVFAKYLHQSPVENAYALAAKGAATFVHKDLIGPNGAHLAALLQMAQHEGELSPERASFVAKELRDWLDMRTGKYHEIKNQYYKAALATVNFLSTVSSLPLAAISSTVEFAQIYRNLNLPQSLKATKHLLKGFGAEMAGTIMSMTPAGPSSKLVSDYRQQLFEAGFSHEGDIGRRLDVVSGYYQSWTEGFFKMTGLTSVTNVTRYAKLAIGADAIKSWLDTVQNGDINNPTQKEKDARDHLVRIGVDVDWIMSVDRKDPAIQERMEKEFSTGTHNFVTEAVIHPTKMNRPKFYSDPYLQLFTQFQGYVSAFTANVLPRLLGDLRKGGSDDQANAAATIAMMFALAYFALYMKDLIKYGESPPPWLKDDDKFQRYIGQVGLLGTSQRIVDAVSPITPQDQRQHSVFAKAYNAISDQAPALSYLNKINDALSAQPGSQTKQLVRTLPVFGTSPAFAKYLQKELGDI